MNSPKIERRSFENEFSLMNHKKVTYLLNISDLRNYEKIPFL